MQSKAATVKEYLASLPEDRRAAIEAVRQVILKNMDAAGGLAEGMSYGMIGYHVPHSVFPAGYHCDPKQPLPYANLASQKNHMALYLMCTYGNEEAGAWFREAWAKAGKKLDKGKACLRFKKVEDLALDVIAQLLKRVTVKKYVDHYEKALAEMGKGGGGARAKTTKAATATAKKKPVVKKKAAVGKAQAKKKK